MSYRKQYAKLEEELFIKEWNSTRKKALRSLRLRKNKRVEPVLVKESDVLFTKLFIEEWEYIRKKLLQAHEKTSAGGTVKESSLAVRYSHIATSGSRCFSNM